MIGTVTAAPRRTLPWRGSAGAAGHDPGATAYLDLGARLDAVSAVHDEPGAVAWRSLHATWNRPWIIGMGATGAQWRGVWPPWSPSEDSPRASPWSGGHSRGCPRRCARWSTGSGTGGTPLLPLRTRPGEAEVIDLGLTDPRVPELLAVANPDAMVHPGDRRIRGWWGIQAGALEPPAQGSTHRLVAVAAVTTMRPGVPHLGSVATHPSWRGRGLSRDLCARLTRDALAEGAPAVTLGMHAANRSARAVYGSLEYTVGQRWASGRVPGSRSSRD